MLSKKRGKRSGKIRDLVRARDICAHKYVLQWRPISPSFTIHFAYRNFLRVARLSKTHRWFSHECARQPDRWLITHRSWQLSINTIFLPLDRSGQEAKRKKWKKTSIEDRSRVSPMQMKSNCLSSIHVCVCVCTSARLAPRVFQDICTCVRSWTITKDTRVKTGTKFTLVDTFSATKSRRLRFRGSPSNPNTSGKEWYWLRKWGHRVWFHCVAMVHRSLIARTWALPDPSLLNSPYELSNVDTL